MSPPPPTVPARPKRSPRKPRSPRARAGAEHGRGARSDERIGGVARRAGAPSMEPHLPRRPLERGELQVPVVDEPGGPTPSPARVVPEPLQDVDRRSAAARASSAPISPVIRRILARRGRPLTESGCRAPPRAPLPPPGSARRLELADCRPRHPQRREHLRQRGPRSSSITAARSRSAAAAVRPHGSAPGRPLVPAAAPPACRGRRLLVPRRTPIGSGRPARDGGRALRPARGRVRHPAPRASRANAAVELGALRA